MRSFNHSCLSPQIQQKRAATDELLSFTGKRADNVTECNGDNKISINRILAGLVECAARQRKVASSQCT